MNAINMIKRRIKDEMIMIRDAEIQLIQRIECYLEDSVATIFKIEIWRNLLIIQEKNTIEPTSIQIISLEVFGGQNKYCDKEIYELNKLLFNKLSKKNNGKYKLNDYGLYCEIVNRII